MSWGEGEIEREREQYFKCDCCGEDNTGPFKKPIINGKEVWICSCCFKQFPDRQLKGIFSKYRTQKQRLKLRKEKYEDKKTKEIQKRINKYSEEVIPVYLRCSNCGCTTERGCDYCWDWPDRRVLITIHEFIKKYMS